MTVSWLRPDGLVRSPWFSHVAVVPPGATTIVVGGQNAVDAAGRLVGEGDAAAQTRQVMANLRTALGAAGATLADVVGWSIDVVDGVDLEAAFAVVADEVTALPEPPLVGVRRVAGLAVPGALVELSATAAVVR